MEITRFTSHLDRPIVTIFGGAGYLGSHITRNLIKENYRVRVVDNFLFGNDGIAGFTAPNLQVVEGDIGDVKTVSSALKDSEIVILLSAIVGHRINSLNRKTIRNVNFLASSVVLDAALEHGINRFIFASTDSVYGVQQGLIYETGTPAPISLYSRLKLRMEERIIKAKSGEFHPTSLRIANCYGYSPRMRFDLVANGLMRDAICKKEICIASSDQTRSFIHVSDAARAFTLCLNAHENLISGEIFNIANPEQIVSISHLANLVKSIEPETHVTLNHEPADITDYNISCTKAAKVLDFTPEKSLLEGMKEVQEHLAKGTWEDPYSLKYHNT